MFITRVILRFGTATCSFVRHFDIYLSVVEADRNNLVNWGAVPALLIHLKAPEPVREGDGVNKPCEHDVEEKCVHLLGLLAIIKSENEQLIVDAGALPCLVDLLKRHKTCGNSRKLIRRLVTAIGTLAYQDNNIQNRVRMEGGIPPLVELLEFDDAKVFRCNALLTLVLMLGSGDNAMQYEAVGLVLYIMQLDDYLVLSVPTIHIPQRGAIQPLIDMLKFPNAHVYETSSFALAMLSQDTDNQASIVLNGGVEPLFNLLCFNNGSIQHDASFTLEGLAMNEPAKERLGKTMNILKEKMHG
ncbi:hypothetical protein K1719_021879 [Acacia pycnantha]|nr:hypothetical protein K1719_021879 [Acacia pycnantha]